jgi:hypothetical protein
MEMIDLYHVYSTVKEFHRHRDVRFEWFILDRGGAVGPYAELIAGYDPPTYYDWPETAVNELFTADEARMLVEYLDKHHRTESVQSIERADLPFAPNTMPYVAIPVGGPQDFLMLSERDEWPLPFKVWGYYDLRQHDRVPDCEQATAEKA